MRLLPFGALHGGLQLTSFVITRYCHCLMILSQCFYDCSIIYYYLLHKAFGLVVCELPTDLEVVGSSLVGGICEIYCEIGGMGCEINRRSKNNGVSCY